MKGEKLNDIDTPHEHDVLSGRGNFVNYHSGNGYFRELVKKHKVDYVKAPKSEKAKFSRMIVDQIRSRDPPGRFLKEDEETKKWFDIGEKKALDKTRQALREGAPEIEKLIGLKPKVSHNASRNNSLKTSESSIGTETTQVALNTKPKSTKDSTSILKDPIPVPSFQPKAGSPVSANDKRLEEMFRDVEPIPFVAKRQVTPTVPNATGVPPYLHSAVASQDRYANFDPALLAKMNAVDRQQLDPPIRSTVEALNQILAQDLEPLPIGPPQQDMEKVDSLRLVDVFEDNKKPSSKSMTLSSMSLSTGDLEPHFGESSLKLDQSDLNILMHDSAALKAEAAAKMRDGMERQGGNNGVSQDTDGIYNRTMNSIDDEYGKMLNSVGELSLISMDMSFSTNNK